MGYAGRNIKIGIALGGGGAKGLAHIGVLKVLEEKCIVPDLVSGTSMGALVGALYCYWGDIGEVERFVCRFENADLHPYLFPRLAASGLISEKRVRLFLKSLFADTRIEDLQRPFFCTATDVEWGDEVIFARGSLVEAIMASISIPVIFPPQPFQGRFLVDGGLVDLVPVDVLKRNGAAFTIAVNVYPPRRKTRLPIRPARKKRANRMFITSFARLLERSRRKSDEKRPNMLEALFSSFEIMQQKMSLAKLKNDDPDAVIQVDTSDFKIYEFYSPGEIISRGEETMRRLMGFVLHQLEMSG